MTNPAFLTLLIDAIARAIPADAEQAEATREAGLAIARTLLEAWQPADAMEAMLATRAIAAHLAAMDSFARAAKPGLSDEKAVRLRNNAIAAGRLFDTVLRTFRRQRQPARAEPQPQSPTARVRRGAEPPLPIHGLSDAVIQATRRASRYGETALSPVLPTVLAPR